jgi:NADH/NAD ratio-sensing transcriptional regulator Rex
MSNQKFEKIMLQLNEALKKQNISVEQLAEKMGKYPSNMRRDLSGKHGIGLKYFLEIAEFARIELKLKKT